jgi:hypothetical protein
VLGDPFGLSQIALLKRLPTELQRVLSTNHNLGRL